MKAHSTETRDEISREQVKKNICQQRRGNIETEVLYTRKRFGKMG